MTYTCSVSNLSISVGEEFYIFPLLPYMFQHRFTNARAAKQAKELKKLGKDVSEITLTNAHYYRLQDDKMHDEYSSGKPLLQPADQYHQSNLFATAFLPIRARLNSIGEIDIPFVTDICNEKTVSYYEYLLGDTSFVYQLRKENRSNNPIINQMSFAYVRKDVFDKLVAKNFFWYSEDRFQIKKKLKKIIKDEDTLVKPLKERYYLDLYKDQDLQFLFPLAFGAKENNVKIRRRLVKTLRNPAVQSLAEDTFKFLMILNLMHKPLMPQLKNDSMRNAVYEHMFTNVINNVAKKQYDKELHLDDDVA